MIETALAEFDEPKSMIATVKSYGVFTVAVDGIGKVEEAHKQVKRLRIDIEKRRKSLNEGALTYQRTINSEAKRLTAEVEPIEETLEKERNAHEAEKEREKAAKEAAKAAVLQQRVERLAQAGCIAGDVALLAAMSDDDYEWHLRAKAKQAQEEQAEREAARHETLRVEAERQAAIAAQEAENNAERLRLEKIRKDMAAAAAEDRRKAEAADLAQRQRMEAERRQLEAEREELRRQQQEIQLRQEAERRAEHQREDNARKAAEEAARIARLEALKPEIEKAEAFGNALLTDARDELERIGNPPWAMSALEAVKRCAFEIVAIARGEA